LVPRLHLWLPAREGCPARSFLYSVSAKNDIRIRLQSMKSRSFLLHLPDFREHIILTVTNSHFPCGWQNRDNGNSLSLRVPFHKA
jgi:hypothetical protein